MRKQYSIAEARNNLAKLVREAEAGESIELTREVELHNLRIDPDEVFGNVRDCKSVGPLHM